MSLREPPALGGRTNDVERAIETLLAVEPAASMPAQTRGPAAACCRTCGSTSLDRSRRGPFERIVTSILRRNAYRCRLCGWRGWLPRGTSK